MTLLDAMPRRPLRVWPPRNAIGAAMCLLVFVPLLWFAGRPVWETLRDDMTLPGNSPAASQASIDLHCTKPPLMHLCDATVRYTARGQAYVREISLFTIWNRPTPGRYRVQYLRSDPGHIKVDWGGDIDATRLLSFAAAVLAALIGLPLALRSAWPLRRALRRNPWRPVLAEVLDIRPARDGVWYAVSWTDPFTGAPRQGGAHLDGKAAPVWADPLHTCALALAGPGGQVAVLDAALRRASLRPDERAAIQKAARTAERAEV